MSAKAHKCLRQFIVLLFTAITVAGLFWPKKALAETRIKVWASVNPPWPELVEAFEKDHPDIKVDLENNSASEFQSGKFVAALATGTGPDVLFQNRHSLSELAAIGAFAPVNEYLERDQISVDGWASAQFKEMSWQGQQYGLPMETDTRFLYWNKEVFSIVGLDPEQPPRTWQELEAITPRLNQMGADGQPVRLALDPYIGNTWFWLYAWQNKGEFFADEAHRVATTDHPNNVEALEWLVQYYDNYLGGYANSNAFVSSGQGDPFAEGRVAMIGHGNWMLNHYASATDFEWGTAPMPIPADGVKSTWSCGFSLVMPISVKHPDAAWEFIKWATGPDGVRIRLEHARATQIQAWQTSGGKGDPVFFPPLPTNREAQQMVIEEYLPLIPEDMQPHFALASDALNWTKGCGSEMAPLGLVYWNAVHEAAVRAFKHETTPKGALVDARRKVQAELDRFYAEQAQGR